MGKEAEAEERYSDFKFQLVLASMFIEMIVMLSLPGDLERKQD